VAIGDNVFRCGPLNVAVITLKHAMNDESLANLYSSLRLVEQEGKDPALVVSAFRAVVDSFATNSIDAARGLIPIAADVCSRQTSVSQEILAESLRPLYASGIDDWENVRHFIKSLLPRFSIPLLQQTPTRRGCDFLRQLLSDDQQLASAMQLMYDDECEKWAKDGLGIPQVPKLLEN